MQRVSIADDQVLVRVHDAGVNPIDWKIRQGYLKQVMPASFPLTIGQDFAGEVADHGKAVDRFAAGDRVFGFAQGAYAEYVAASVSEIAAMPASMDFVTAAALPTAGSTALQVIRDVVKAKSGMTILVHGAAGGVGSFASQIAKNFGARVIGTASGDDIEYLKSIGVDEVIDYQRERFEEKAGEVDAVVDLVGGDTLVRSYMVVKSGGVLVTTVHALERRGDDFQVRRPRARHFDVPVRDRGHDAPAAGFDVVAGEAVRGTGPFRRGMDAQPRAADPFDADPHRLKELAKLVEQGALKPRLAQTMNLSQAKEAQELSESGGTHGKVILKVA